VLYVSDEAEFDLISDMWEDGLTPTNKSLVYKQWYGARSPQFSPASASGAVAHAQDAVKSSLEEDVFLEPEVNLLRYRRQADTLQYSGDGEINELKI
jgi:hypothetical protein